MRVLARGAYGQAATGELSSSEGARQPRIEIATTPEAYRQLWAKHVGTGNPPPIDFASEIVAFLLLGLRSTGGYSVEPQEVIAEQDMVRIKAAVRSPEPGGMVTMAFTAPYAVIAIPVRGIDRAEWIDGEGKMIARSERPVAR